MFNKQTVESWVREYVFKIYGVGNEEYIQEIIEAVASAKKQFPDALLAGITKFAGKDCLLINGMPYTFRWDENTKDWVFTDIRDAEKQAIDFLKRAYQVRYQLQGLVIDLKKMHGDELEYPGENATYNTIEEFERMLSVIADYEEDVVSRLTSKVINKPR